MSESEVGEITMEKFNEVEQYYEIEWTIKDFFSYTDQDKFYLSPSFSVLPSNSSSDLDWFFRIYPTGNSEKNEVGWIKLHLCIDDYIDVDFTPKNANFSLGVRKVDGKVEVLKEVMNYIFSKKEDFWEDDKLLERSKLSERRSELAPSGVLILTCTLRITEVCALTSRLVNLAASLKEMFTSQIGCDATLKVQNEEFPVHRAILESRSPVFKSMFEAEMKEKHTGVVDIVDCHPGSFKDFLVFIYSAQFENSSGDIFELYKIAHKYCVEELKKLCVFYITRDISVGNVIDVVIFSHQYDIDEVKTKSQRFFNRNAASVFRSDKWKSLLRNDPPLAEELLINITKEMEFKEKYPFQEIKF